MMNDLIVNAANLSKSYRVGSDGVSAIAGVSLVIERGEVVPVLGRSGQSQYLRYE